MSPSTSGQPPPVFKGLGSGRAGPRGAARGSRPPAGRSAWLLLRGGRPGAGTGSPAQAETAAAAGVLGARRGDRQRRGQQPSRDSRAPGGRPRAQGGDPAGQAGAERARRTPGEARGSRPAGSWRLDAWTPGRLGAVGRAARSRGRRAPRDAPAPRPPAEVRQGRSRTNAHLALKWPACRQGHVAARTLS